MAMDEVRRQHFVLTAVAARLSSESLPWRVEHGRVTTVSDGPLTVVTRSDCDGAPVSFKHVELGVTVVARDGTETLLWDCAVGLADTEEDAIVEAVNVWAERTMPVFWELFSGNGTFAD